jgi:hypothetical protein
MKALPPKKCDICEKDIGTGKLLYDAKHSLTGRWAWMCSNCFKKYGMGLGVELGQEYDAETHEKTRG